MAYKQTGDWGWEFYPPPYAFLAPPDSAPQPAPILSGLSGCGCGGKCGGCESHSHGMGLFDDFSLGTWGLGEWVAVGGVLLVLRSIWGQAGRDAKAVKRRFRRR
jgi:hypothetical protein